MSLMYISVLPILKPRLSFLHIPTKNTGAGLSITYVVFDSGNRCEKEYIAPHNKTVLSEIGLMSLGIAMTLLATGVGDNLTYPCLHLYPVQLVLD